MHIQYYTMHCEERYKHQYDQAILPRVSLSAHTSCKNIALTSPRYSPASLNISLCAASPHCLSSELVGVVPSFVLQH